MDTKARGRELRRNRTPSEKLLWSVLRSKQLCGMKFRQQHPIGSYFADFACLDERVVVEIDGGYHDQTQEDDLRRQRDLEAMGWRVIRFHSRDVLDDVEAVARGISAFVGKDYTFHRRNANPSGIKSPNAKPFGHIR